MKDNRLVVGLPSSHTLKTLKSMFTLKPKMNEGDWVDWVGQRV